MGGGSSTTTTNQNEQATTVPQTPQYAQDPVKNYYSAINNYQQSDPYSFVTPTNALQQGAFNNAGGLFQSGQLYGQAAQGAQNVMNATPTTYTAGFNGAQTGLLGNAAQATAQGYQAPNMGQASTYSPTMAGNAAQATAQGYSAPNLGNAAQATSQGYGASGYQAPQLGQAAQAGATGYAAPTLGNAAQATGQGYQTGTLGSAAQSAGANLGGQATQATAASLLDNLQAYQNPATQSLVNTTLSSMDDNAARVRAAQQAQFAKSGAFGGSRAGIAQAQTEADLGRERGLAEANLRSQAWNAATQLSGQDATNRQATSLFNAGAQNQRDEAGAGLAQANSQFNANAQNQFGLAGFDATNQANQFGANAANSASQFNAGQQNQFGLAGANLAADAAQFGANAQNTAGIANANAQNQFGLAQGQMSADAGQFNANAANAANQFGAGAANTANLANTAARNQFGLAQGQMAADAAQFGAAAQNQAGLFNAGAANDMSLANQNAANSAGQFNSGQQNQFASQQAGLLADAGQFNAGAQNQAGLANMAAQNQYGLSQFDAQNQANQFNASQANQMSQFNTDALNTAQQQQLARQLQASGLLGDIAGQYGQDYRADLGMQSDLGNQLYQLQDRYNQAPLTQLQNVGNLMNPGLIDSLSGKTITSNQSGVSQEKKSGGLFNSLLGIASVATPFIPSDRRLKDDIRRVGKTDAGLPIYTYRYKGDSETRFGVIAQDVEEMQPEALGPIWRGFKTVNYAEVR